MTMIEVGCEYAKGYIDGTITSKNDGAKLTDLFNAKFDNAKIANYTDSKGNTLDNYYTILLAPVDFADYL